ncbi:hypothetical protein [Lysinibacillus sp. NPDC093688]|uniref:hypothetical protein n=1 Tax=Lysinibacillus sp. NPDC093688 TaxID=3390577 RepID=UPI003D05432C
MLYNLSKEVYTSSHNIVIYGTGEIGREIFNSLSDNGLENKVMFFLESSPKEKYFKGKIVKNPDELTNQEIDSCIFIVASIAYANEMLQTLLSVGILNNNIYPCELIGKHVYIPSELLITKFILYPKVEQETQLIKLIKKLKWYLPYQERYPRDIYISLSPSIDINKYYNILKEHGIKINKEDVQLDNDSLLLIWDKKQGNNFEINKFKDYTYCIDETYHGGVESVNLAKLFYLTLPLAERNSQKDNSIEKFILLQKQAISYNSTLVLGTGPSISQMDYKELQKHFVVMCNSIVHNVKLLKNIKNGVMTFSDPAFHLSYNEYSINFRQALTKLVEEKKIFCITLVEWIPLLKFYYPRLADYLIGIDIKNLDTFEFPSTNALHVKNVMNVATNYMIPIASSLKKEVYIAGLDGKSNSQDKIWTHDNRSQQNDLITKVRKTHPSAFRDIIDQEWYYSSHLKNLKELLEYGESEGNSYTTITKSNISSLIERER